MSRFTSKTLNVMTTKSFDDILNQALDLRGMTQDTLVERWLDNFESCMGKLVSADWIKTCDPGSDRARENFVRQRITGPHFQLNMLFVCLDLLDIKLDLVTV